MSIFARNVSKQFGEFIALDDVSVEVTAGSLTALLGPSGSGKSTLLRVIAGLETPDSGTVFIDEQNVTGRPPQDRGVGFVFQHYAAFKHMTVYDNVAFGMKIRKRPKAEIASRVSRAARARPARRSRGPVPVAALGRPAPADGARPGARGRSRGAAARRAVRRARRARAHRAARLAAAAPRRDAHDDGDRHARPGRGDGGRRRGRRHEQAAGSSRSPGPRELYERPANEFVMTFVGQANRLDDAFVRPHDLELTLEPNGTTREAMIERIVHLGFEVRVELVARRRRAALGAAHARRGRAARARRGPDRLRQADPPDVLRLDGLELSRLPGSTLDRGERPGDLRRTARRRAGHTGIHRAEDDRPRASVGAALARVRDGPRGDHDASPRLVRDAERAPERAPRDLRCTNAVAFTGAAQAVRGLVRPALPGADRARLPHRRRARRPPERSRAERVSDDVGVHPGLSARAKGDRLTTTRLPGRRALGLHAVDLLRNAPHGRGGRLSGVHLGHACVPARPGGPVAARRRAGHRDDRTRVPCAPPAGRARNRPPDRGRRVRAREAGTPSPSGAQRCLRNAPARCGRVRGRGRGRGRAARVRAARGLARRLRRDRQRRPRPARDPEIARLASGVLLAGSGDPAGDRRARVAVGALRPAARAAGAARVRLPRCGGCGRRAPSDHRLRPPFHRRARAGPISDLPRADRPARLRLRTSGSNAGTGSRWGSSPLSSQPASRSARSRPIRLPASTPTRRSRLSTRRSSPPPARSETLASCSRAARSCSA